MNNFLSNALIYGWPVVSIFSIIGVILFLSLKLTGIITGSWLFILIPIIPLSFCIAVLFIFSKALKNFT